MVGVSAASVHNASGCVENAERVANVFKRGSRNARVVCSIVLYRFCKTKRSAALQTPRFQRSCSYTHYSSTGATQIDRFYAKKNLFERKIAAKTVVAAFTDHHAVTLRLALDIPIIRRGRGLWKMNSSLLGDGDCKEKLRQTGNNGHTRNGIFRTRTCGGPD